MAIKFKDYYEVLRVPRGASEGDIKMAYRKLARKHHPDLFSVGKKAAEERFKEINEAYEVLRDKEKRAHYDQLGSHWKEGMSYRPAASSGGMRGTNKDRKGTTSAREREWQRRSEWEEEEDDFPSGRRDLFSDFFESLFGGGATPAGHGASARERARGYGPGTFGRDKGFSRHYPKPERGKDIESQMELTLEEVARGTKRHIWVERPVTCSLCNGRRLVGQQTCARCKSTGVVSEAKELIVTIPPGIKDGDKVRLSGQGDVGHGGANAGDRFIEVKFRPHPQFTIADGHLEMDMDVTPWEAVLGTEIKITTLYGDVILKIPAGSQNGQQFRLRGKGLPVRGTATASKGEKQDLYVRIAVNLPSSITPEERQHYLELARLAKNR
ncbi:MAG: J domain-containing protein [Nitrospirae bacterium]|nr:J domain-containing protein [Candidatus Troglogloeales bacterium]MBI3598807.1 J domain-containing protein [Candidatus Troglogloeales bacterium]